MKSKKNGEITYEKGTFIGELNQTVSSVNKHLSTSFQTQICVNSLEMVKGMNKVFDAEVFGNAYLLKPIERKDLLDTIEGVLAGEI